MIGSLHFRSTIDNITKRVINIAKPHRYTLGGTPEVYGTAEDQNGALFIPSESRISIKQPDGDIITYSGGDMIVASGYYGVLYRPPTTGWYATETWAKDGTGREDTDSGGFEVIDSVYPD
jgi:hypothetical protein